MSVVVEVIATGARTPVGLTAESSAAAVRAGITRGREYPFAGATGDPVVVASDAKLDGKLAGRERLLPMVEGVLEEVTRKLAAGEPHRGKCYLPLALPEARPGFSDRDAAWVVDTLRAWLRGKGLEIQVDLVGRGHAGTIRAIELVAQECARHPDALFLVMGADSYHHTETFIWLERARQFAQPSVRSGFIPGEAAGCLAFASSGLRSRLRAPRLAVLRGAKTAQETRLRNSETGSFGMGMSQAVLGAVASLVLPRDAADVTYSDINGERYRSEEFGFVAMRAPQAFKSVQYEAPADCWGDVGAAFGALGGILAVQSFARSYTRGPRALVMAGSESGLRGAFVLQDPRLQ